MTVRVPIDVVVLPHAKVPAPILAPAHPGDAGMDLYAAEDVTLLPGQRALVPTGLAVAIPEGTELQVRPKSGLAISQGLTVLNTPGTVDSGFRGEIQVIVLNTNPVVSPDLPFWMLQGLHGVRAPESLLGHHRDWQERNTIYIKAGQKIAQAVCASYLEVTTRVVDRLPMSVRGTDGFGSTGA